MERLALALINRLESTTREVILPTYARLDQKTAFPGACILIVDDEKTLRYSLTDLFKRVGYETACAASGQEALEHIRRQSFDVILLDLKMPGMDGVEVLRRARPQAPDAIFIIMTAYGTLESAIAGIRQGAYDYLPKPSPLETLLNTVEAGLTKREARRQQLRTDDPVDLLEQALINLKRGPIESSKTAQDQQEPAREDAQSESGKDRFLRAPGLLVDTQKHLVLVNNTPTHLTETEFDILTYLMRYPNQVVTPQALVRHLRGYELGEKEASALLRSHIHRLRDKIEPETSADPRFIQTVRGRGYCFNSVI